ncbi:MAG: hypothetical protein LAT82_02725 [Nanoarchaeota archaeon]|nr:hypothetical protein [Nanoarchaeota archaeon]
MKKQKVILVDAYNTFVTQSGVDEEMFELLEDFENTKIIVTNANTQKQQELGIVNMPYEVFTLSFNPEKINPEYFRIFLGTYGLEPKNCVYFDHNSLAVENANKIGIISFHFNHEKRDLKELRTFLETYL